MCYKYESDKIKGQIGELKEILILMQEHIFRYGPVEQYRTYRYLLQVSRNVIAGHIQTQFSTLMYI